MKSACQNADELSDALAAAKERVIWLEKTLTEERALNARMTCTMRDLRRSKRQADQALQMSFLDLSRARRENAALLASTSWRITAPVRAAIDLTKSSRRHLTLKVQNGLAGAAQSARARLKPAIRLLRRRMRVHDHRLIRDSALFDPAWYLAEYPEVLKAGLDPLDHFLNDGWRKGYNPSASFDTLAYLISYPAVARARINPLLDYLREGSRRGRIISRPTSQQASAIRTVFDPAASRKWVAALRAHPAAARTRAEPPLVSVILPSRDRVKFLPQAIDSVLAQSHRRWELIVVDDGSSDGTSEIVPKAYQDSRILFARTPGLGVSGARNAGLSEAGGEFVAYLDSDNSWTPEYLELMLAEFERSGAASVYAGLRIHEEKASAGTAKSECRAIPFDYKQLRFANFIDLNIFMHRREMFDRLGGFDTKLRRAVDWDLILRYTCGDPVSFANFIGAEYDHSDRSDRLTLREPHAFKNIVRNKHWIDWDREASRASMRDRELVSVIVCVRGPMQEDEEPLRSLFTHEAGQEFELVLVDNGCDAVTKALMADWQRRRPMIRIVEPGQDVHFPLGANIGFATSSGATVVFLNEDARVSPEWLRPLTRALQDDDVLGAQPKVLNPDGTIHSVGLAFSEHSPIAYPIYSGQPGALEATSRPRAIAAIGASCAAFRAKDFARLRGFHPLFPFEGADVDFCLRLGDGAPVFRSVPDATVVQHPSHRAIRPNRMESARRELASLWRGRVAADDLAHYERDGFSPGRYLPDRPTLVEAGLAQWRPKTLTRTPGAVESTGPKAPTAAPSSLNNRVIALKIGCPRPEVKDHWGDYHFAVALAAAFLRKGVTARIDFAADANRYAQPGEVNLVLRGRHRWEPRPGALNLMWLISHPDRVKPDELRRFDHVFIASKVWTDRISHARGIRCQTLLQCTDSSRFHPGLYDPRVRSAALFVANSRKVLRSVVREAVEQDLPIDIYGEMWEGLAPAEWIKGETIENVDLPRYYASADVVLNDHWDSMRENGFVSNRIFDVLATGAPLVTDRVSGMPDDIAEACHFFGDGVTLTEAVNGARASRNETLAEPHDLPRRARAIAETVCQNHSFDARADTILAVIAKHHASGGHA